MIHLFRPATNPAGILALAVAALLGANTASAQESSRPPLALMGTVPIYWGEAEGLAGLLDTQTTGHWARPVLERSFELVPLDYLSSAALEVHGTLLLAQPRALSAEENVALDGWVRGGGRLLLFADPMMTGDSHYGLGDRRRPQDVALLSPILAHWGLDLRFDAQQPAGVQLVEGDGWNLPVNLAGQFYASGGGTCRFEADRVIARCRLGAGEVLLMADAALLDFERPPMAAETGLQALLAAIFGESGEIAGLQPVRLAAEAGNGASLVVYPHEEAARSHLAAP